MPKTAPMVFLCSVCGLGVANGSTTDDTMRKWERHYRLNFHKQAKARREQRVVAQEAGES